MPRVLAVLAALFAVWLVACGFLFLWPHVDRPGHADAVVVLAGDAGHRIPRGLDAVTHGIAPNLLLSREPGSKWKKRWGSLCGGPRTTCFTARPYSTQGEAETVGRLMRRRGWHSILVVSSRYHVFRARILFRRCVRGRVAAVGSSYDVKWLPLILPLETVKLVRAETTDRHC